MLEMEGYTLKKKLVIIWEDGGIPVDCVAVKLL